MVTLSDYEAFKQKQSAKGAGAVGVVLAQDFGATPDATAADLNLAAEHAQLTGAPVAPSSLVKEYRSTFQANADALKASTILSASPTLSAWLREPDNAAVSRDDLANLSWWENIAIVPRGIASALPAMNEGVWGLAAAAAAVPGRNPVSDYLQMQAKASRTIKEQWAGPTGGWLGTQVQGASQSVGLMLPGLAATVASGGAALPAVAAAYIVPGVIVQGGQSAEKALEAGKSGAHALLYGAQDAVVEALFERIPVGKLLGDIEQGTGFGKMLLRQIASEVPTEVATTLLQNFNEYANLTPDKPIGEFLSEQPAAIRDTVVQTLLVAFGTTGTVAGARKVFKELEDRQAKTATANASKRALEEISRTALTSKLRERMPDKFRQFIERATANGPVENIFIPADKFVEYFQAQGIDPAEMASTLDGVTAADLETAIETGGGQGENHAEQQP